MDNNQKLDLELIGKYSSELVDLLDHVFPEHIEKALEAIAAAFARVIRERDRLRGSNFRMAIIAGKAVGHLRALLKIAEQNLQKTPELLKNITDFLKEADDGEENK